MKGEREREIEKENNGQTNKKSLQIMVQWIRTLVGECNLAMNKERERQRVRETESERVRETDRERETERGYSYFSKWTLARTDDRRECETKLRLFDNYFRQ